MTAFDPFAPAVTPASERQVSYALSLLAGRDITAHGSASYRTRLAELAADHDQVRALDRHAASALIDTLTALPKVAAATAPSGTIALLWPGVPAGHYALTVDGRTRFYRVDRPESGKWAGAVFIREQAGDEFYPMRGQRKDIALDSIAADPAKASRAYGLSIGRCGVCGRSLTTESSRALGIGPICATKHNW